MAEYDEKADIERKIADFKVRCRDMGLKVTPQRVAVYEVLAGSVEHPSADMVYRAIRAKMPNISLDTVNRTLITFSRIGAAFTVEGSGDAKRFDGNLESHQHFKCVKCKRIVDLHHEPFDNIEVPSSIDSKYEILRKSVYFEGICDLCTAEV